MKLKLMLLVSLFAFGFAMSATAGSVTDVDSDGVPDAFDNCPTVANGPLAGGCSAQQNVDGDPYGDACDSDYTTTVPNGNDGFVDINDFGVFFASFVATSPLTGEEDHDCNGDTDINDFGRFFDQFVATVPGV